MEEKWREKTERGKSWRNNMKVLHITVRTAHYTVLRTETLLNETVLC